jgi:type IV secretory pathway VirJ component
MVTLVALPAPPCHAEASRGADPALVRQLPLVELPVAHAQNDVLAIILSGDGGWADLDRDFGNAFQHQGLATVGFDCLKYFWKARQPAQVSRDLEATIRYYLEAWNKQRVLLVGYSFGADWLPFLVNRLPEDLQQRILLVALLAPGDSVNVEIRMGDWFRDIRRPGALSVAPEAARIQQRVLCVYGAEEEKQSVCPGLKGDNVRLLRTPGGHHFGGHYDSIENAILKYAE